MKLGAFSVSLTVKDIHASKSFYEKLGFTVIGGELQHHYLIMKNENCVIGLFQGMFDKNILTFNPGWNGNGENLDSFTDVRELQKQLKEKDVTIIKEVDGGEEGPAYFTIEDPDGNHILIDQHR